MLLRKTGRAVTAMLAIVALLLCEAAWATHAYGRYAGQFGAAVPATGGCHSPDGPNSPDSATPSPCESAQAPSDFFHIPPVTLAAIFSSVPLAAEPCAAHDRRGVALTPLAGAPPPLHLLHCRLRN